MGSCRRQRGYPRHQGVQGTRSQARKPPLGSWQPTVPSWEKQFCISVGSVPWDRLVEAKKYLHIHEKVLKWNDSAVEEAFHNAKKRYWAGINGLPCSVSLPDPNIHIDEVDWESKVDPELLLDLDRGPEAFYGSNSDPTVIFGDALANPSFACDGWGDLEEEWPKDETSWKVNCMGGENVYGTHPAEQVAADADALCGSKQGQFQGWNQRFGTQEDSNVRDYGRLENDKDRTIDNWDTWDWDKMNSELEPGGCENAHGVDSADQVAAGCDPFWGSNNPVERIAADGDTVWVSKQSHSQKWNQGVSTQESRQYIACDNWDTWDWDKMNRELEPDRQYIPKHKHAGFGRNEKQMRYGWNHGKGMKPNYFVY